MKNLFIIAVLISVLAVAGCVQKAESQTTTVTPPAQPPSQTPSSPVVPPPQTTPPAQTQPPAVSVETTKLGFSKGFTLTAKEFAGIALAIAEDTSSDACMISILGEGPDTRSPGNAAIWHYKSYLPSKNKAIVSTVQTKLVAGGRFEAYAETKAVVVFRDEPFKKCINFLNIIDSDKAAQAVPFVVGSNGGISLEVNHYIVGEEYTFTDLTNGKDAKVNAVTGKLV